VKEVLDGSPEKSDPKDAMLVAELVAQGRGCLFCVSCQLIRALSNKVIELMPSSPDLCRIVGRTERCGWRSRQHFKL
jgi:hypothetical protein